MKDNTFKKHPKLERYFKTSDGTKFYNDHDAKTHARNLKDKNVEEVKNTFSNKSEGEGAADTKTNPMVEAKKRAEAIAKLETIEAVEKALKGETAKSVKTAGANRIVELKAALATTKKVEAIAKLETVEAVEKALKGETEESVLKAGAVKIEAIKASINAIDKKEKTE